MPFTALAIGAGVGLLKSVAIDGPKEERQRKLAAATQRYSPWTHLQANPIQEADPFGSALQFGATGAQLGVNKQASDAASKLSASQASWLDKNPYNFGTGSAMAAQAPASGYSLAAPGQRIKMSDYWF